MHFPLEHLIASNIDRFLIGMVNLFQRQYRVYLMLEIVQTCRHWIMDNTCSISLLEYSFGLKSYQKVYEFNPLMHRVYKNVPLQKEILPCSQQDFFLVGVTIFGYCALKGLKIESSTKL